MVRGVRRVQAVLCFVRPQNEDVDLVNRKALSYEVRRLRFCFFASGTSTNLRFESLEGVFMQWIDGSFGSHRTRVEPGGVADWQGMGEEWRACCDRWPQAEVP